jgi:hypothetical protein
LFFTVCVSDCKVSAFLRIVQVLSAKSFPNAIFYGISQSIGKYGKLTKGVYGTLFVRKGACAQPSAQAVQMAAMERETSET